MSQRVEIMKKTIPSRVDKQMGMGVVHSNKQVFVSSIEPGSLASEHFRVKDRIVAINGVHVNDKRQCRELILSASTESEFTVEIERRLAEFKLPSVPESEVDEIPNLQFIPSVEAKSRSTKENKKTPKKKSKIITTSTSATALSLYDSYIADDDEFETSFNPLDGIKYPQPQDVQNIIRLRMSQILTDFAQYVSKKQAPKSKCTTNVDKNVSMTNIASDVPTTKELMKLKH